MRYSLARIVAGLDAVGPGYTSYLNRLTGEVVSCSDEELDAADAESSPDNMDRPDWEQEEIELARAVLASDDWLPLPDSFEIHEYQIMENFAESQSGTVQDGLLRSLRGSGAFRRFKDALDLLGIREEWFLYRHRALVEIARDWLEANDLPFDPADNLDEAGPTPAEESVEEGILKRIREYEAAYNAGDADAMAAIYAVDATHTYALGLTHRGRTEIGKGLKDQFAGPFKGTQMTITPLHIRPLSPTVGVEEAAFTLSGLKGADGAVLPPIGGFCLVVYQRDGDAWYIAAAQCMVPPPLPQSSE